MTALSLTEEADASMVRYPSYVLGFEDVRLIRMPSGQWLGTATCKETHKDGYCEIALLHLTGPPDWKITRVLPMSD